ncbi:amino acid adenylation domain-containing protein [Streptomyces sp. NPDC047315]|uniref:amino acid adenylation domain-containing protein n=1 Tax=Streptomyces sp. NPDC047315 TaxID=3155142 RepID=UPI0033E204E5
MDAASHQDPDGYGLADPGFAELLHREEDDAQRRELLADALLEFLVRTRSLEPDADTETLTTVESLIAVELNVVLNAGLGVEIALPEFRGATTPRQLADTVLGLLDGVAGERQDGKLVVDVEGRFEPFGLTDLQQAYLLGRGGFFALGNVPAAFYAEIDAVSVDVGRLEVAWNRVVARHDMLRTVFTDDGRQQALPEVPVYRFECHDLRASGEGLAGVGPVLEDIREEIAGRVRDPGQWPLFEIAVTRLDDERTRVHLAIDLLIADAPGIRQLLGEWLALEDGRDLGPAPQISFRDYVRALEGVEDSSRFVRAREYWLQRLPELPGAPELPMRVAPEAVRTARFSSRSLELSSERWAGLRQGALRRGLTPSMALCWAYAAVLRTWSASDDFTLNVTVNERLPLHPDIDQVIGEYTSQILVAFQVSDTSHVRDQIATLQDRFWRDFEHRAFSGVQVLRELARSEDGTRTTMPFVFDAVLGQDFAEADLPTWLRGLPYVLATAPQVALECQVFELGGSLRVNWAVVEELFPSGLIDSAFAAFARLLERMADDDGFWDVSRLALVDSVDLSAREEANRTGGSLVSGLLHGLGGSLRERGDAVAVIAGDRSLTYGELDRHAARIGRHLQCSGVVPNTLVAVVMEKGWQQPVAALGVLQSGAAYLPIDASWPVERVHRLLERGGCRIALTQRHLRDSLVWPADVAVLAVDDDSVWPCDDSPLTSAAGPEDLAYVIFTSGSTGEPKGVMIDHRGAVNTVADVNDRFRVTSADRVLGLSSLSFDLSVWDIFGTFAAGAALVLPASDAGRDPARWLAQMHAHGITMWNTVPALMEMLVEHSTAHDETFDELRLVLLSGDWIPLGLAGRVRALAPQAEVVSLGGATEASIWSIYHVIGDLAPAWRSVPYGRPLGNQTFHVLDAALDPVPTWVPGELFIGGTGLARGYWADVDKTNERFITHPVTGERLYRTGDLGRYHPDGTIEFLGRNDHQVKVNGYRIELGEIETTITTHPHVKDSIVTATNNHLTAYLTTTTPSTIDADACIADVRAALSAVLPDYMIPRSFVLLDSLPLSANGKVDRGALPVPVTQAGGGTLSPGVLDPGSAHGTEPRNDIERRLGEIWREVLGLESVGIHDDFGQLGGDSLLALRVIGRAADSGLALTARQFFEHPTIAGLAGAATLAAPRTADVQAEVAGDVPLLPAQARLLAGLDASVARHHNYALLFELEEPLEKVALRVALRTIVGRHDALRTGFVHGPEGWRQRVAAVNEVPAVPFEWLDLTDLSTEEQDRAVEDLAQQSQRSFTLAAPPLLRVLYFDRGRDRRPVLLAVAHWLVVDNYSLRLVLEELFAAHAQIVETGHAELPPPTLPASAWARQVTRHAQRLAKTAAAPTPPREGPPHYGVARDAVTLIDVLEAPATARLRDRLLATATMGDVLLAALARSVRTSGLGESTRVDVDGHGRSATLPSTGGAADLSRTVGRLSVRYQLEVHGTADATEAVLSAAAARGARSNGGLDDEVATHGTVAEVDGLPAPASEFAFNYLGSVDELYAIPGLRPSALRPGPLVDPDTPVRHRFDVLCGKVQGELLIGVTCPEADRPEAERLLKNLLAELRGTDESAKASPASDERDTAGSALAASFRRWLAPACAE